MALVTTKALDEITKDRIRVHEPVTSTYTVFRDSGTKYFQLDTYGTIERVHVGKVSQSIQLDEETAIELIKVINKKLNLNIIKEQEL